jgi:hypothetical protein
MKKVKSIVAIVIISFILMGCATPFPIGVAFTDIKVPYPVSGEGAKASKVGQAQCTSILGLVATGDASINKAMQNGQITTISHVDWEANSILGIIGNYKVTVYGE